ncbi:hypothetical protein BJF89_15790 [Corynebacterium sp. CNJ-954]|uniref:hypothetical protein n=1 Tax=Corynebacterium sp. CNJ-954 TaxID=1904962 RepID=UPI0009659D13|nr:hypothetical protein [Corynebacterium sp. CNJ-954]OLT55364.1 hypothetical protein BJF89_15790 [Corynebacterium sp. CNJ-954]
MSVSEENPQSDDIGPPGTDAAGAPFTDPGLNLEKISPVATEDMLPPPAEDENAKVDKAWCFSLR